ncbi:MAG: pantoate--beta-alanine ligase [Burkholderiales bacterium]|jgi:pantoate--beta-alanine ligase|nr:pantoate--beta-alanine ligase [Burkholderiales bacterium]
MEIIRTISELRARLSSEDQVCCVPTMGNIHDGHLSLVRIGKERAPIVVTTVFVNRLQFGQSDDFSRYPRTFEDDCAKLESLGNDIVFCPNEDEMYPEPQVFFIEPPKIANGLEGRFRPGHFRGVCTVVTKLFNAVQPQMAVFGKKDYQQLAIIRELTEQLCLPIEIVPAETVLSEDGLALSSRNRFLNESERSEAPRLRDTMIQIRDAILAGDRKYVAMEYAAGARLARYGWNVDYVVIRAQKGLRRPAEDETNLVVLGAATLGATRLIDNLEINVE